MISWEERAASNSGDNPKELKDVVENNVAVGAGILVTRGSRSRYEVPVGGASSATALGHLRVLANSRCGGRVTSTATASAKRAGRGDGAMKVGAEFMVGREDGRKGSAGEGGRRYLTTARIQLARSKK